MPKRNLYVLSGEHFFNSDKSPLAHQLAILGSCLDTRLVLMGVLACKMRHFKYFNDSFYNEDYCLGEQGQYEVSRIMAFLSSLKSSGQHFSIAETGDEASSPTDDTDMEARDRVMSQNVHKYGSRDNILFVDCKRPLTDLLSSEEFNSFRVEIRRKMNHILVHGKLPTRFADSGIDKLVIGGRPKIGVVSEVDFVSDKHMSL